MDPIRTSDFARFIHLGSKFRKTANWLHAAEFELYFIVPKGHPCGVIRRQVRNETPPSSAG